MRSTPAEDLTPKIRREQDQPLPAQSLAWIWGSLGVALVLSCPGPASSAQAVAPKPTKLEYNLVFSSRMFSAVQAADARAAVMAWGNSLARARKLDLRAEAQIVSGVPNLAAQMRTGEVDLLALPTDEYVDLGTTPPQYHRALLAGVVDGQYLVEYLLVVPRDSDVKNLAGLKGRTLLVYDNYRTCIALPWLDTILLEAGLAPATQHFAHFSKSNKVSTTVLPVFFNKVDACLVTRAALATMSEMNPQLGKQLRVVASSPGVLPSVTLVRARPDNAPEGFNLIKESEELHKTPYGRQILSLFQLDSLSRVTAVDLSTSVDLIRRHRQLLNNRRPSRSSRGAPGKDHPAASKTTLSSATSGGGQ